MFYHELAPILLSCALLVSMFLVVDASTTTVSKSRTHSASASATHRTHSRSVTRTLPLPTPPPTSGAPQTTSVPVFNFVPFIPAGTVALPGLTASPTSFVGTVAPLTSTVPVTLSPLVPQISAASTVVVDGVLRNQVGILLTSYNEFRTTEFISVLCTLLQSFLSSSSDDALTLQGKLNASLPSSNVPSNGNASSSAKPAQLLNFSQAYSAKNVAQRMIPLRSLSPIGTPSSLSRKQPFPKISVLYGNVYYVSLVILPINYTTGTYSQPRKFFPSAGVLATATTETDTLCIAFSQWFRFWQSTNNPKPMLTSKSSSIDWITATILDVQCNAPLPLIPAAASVGINWLWIAFIILGGFCIAMTVYFVFLRSRSDVTVALPPEKEPMNRQSAQDDPNNLESKIAKLDAHTDNGIQIEADRDQLVYNRKKKRIDELISKALTGEATIYGASEEEREMVAIALRNPRFDGGRLCRDGESSPVTVVLENDRLFKLPPTEVEMKLQAIRTPQKVSSSTDGKVTVATFPVSVTIEGAATTTSSGGAAVSVQDLETGTSREAQMKSLLEERSPTPDNGSSALEEDETSRLNRLMTEAALRHVQRREDQVAAQASRSRVKERLQKILEEDSE